MSAKVIYDHRGNVVSSYVKDPDGRVGWIKRQNLAPLVEGLHYAREYGVRNRKEVFRPIAEMPEAVVDDMMRSGRFFDPKELKKWANDPHNKKLRYTNGRY